MIASAGGLGGLGPVAVVRAFDGPVGHLAFDDAGVASEAALGEWFSEDLGDRLLVGGVEAVGGKSPAWVRVERRAARRLRMNDKRWGTRSALSAASCMTRRIA